MDIYRMWFGSDLTRSQCEYLAMDRSAFPMLSIMLESSRKAYIQWIWQFSAVIYVAMCWLKITQVTDTYLTTPESFNRSND